MKCAVALLSLIIAAAAPAFSEDVTGIVDQPCPPASQPSSRLRGEVIKLLIEPRTLTAEDWGGFLKDPEIVRFNQEVEQRARLDWAGLCRYRAANLSTLAESNQPRVVFIGDSITENWTLAHPEFFTKGLVNRGIGGQTSPQMLVRFRADVVALKPKIVHILAGTNDVAGNTGPTSPQDFKNNIMTMVDIAQANGIEVILGTIPPATVFPWRTQVQPKPIIMALNEWLREYAASRKLGLIDYYASLAGAAGELRADLGNDGVHPNRKGYGLMRRLVEAKLSSR